MSDDCRRCPLLIFVIQNLYNITNIVQDSFHTIQLFEEYLKNDYDPNDQIFTFDFVSFYTELPPNFIDEKLNWIQNVFKHKYKNEFIAKYKIYYDIVSMIREGYKLTAKWAIIKIDGKYYIQKKGVIMGVSYAPNLSNLSILIHIIEMEIYNCCYIKLNLRMIDDTIMIINTKNNPSSDIKFIFSKYYPSILDYTVEHMQNNSIKFLDILIMKINNSLHYIMQIKSLKREFFTHFSSNHAKHVKINIIKNMTKRAMIL